MKIETNREAVGILNDVIRELNREYHQEQRFRSCALADLLDIVRQHLGRSE